MPGVVQIRLVDCCCLACIQFTGHCEVKHADHWTTGSLKEGKKLTKKTHWSQFEGIVPKSQKLVMYPLMENTKLRKDRNTIKVQDLQIDEDDIPLAELMRERPRNVIMEKIRKEISPKDVTENNLREKKY